MDGLVHGKYCRKNITLGLLIICILGTTLYFTPRHQLTAQFVNRYLQYVMTNNTKPSELRQQPTDGIHTQTTTKPSKVIKQSTDGTYTQTDHNRLYIQTTQSSEQITSECNNSLVEMVRGSWTPRQTSEAEQWQVERFLTKSRGKFYVPTGLARPDGKCGNTTFDFLKGLQHQALWFRPLCDPKGPTPCCYNNQCVDKTVEECKCANCFDMRTPLNAELADWSPSNKDCGVRQYDTAAACKLLDGATLYFVGDSFLRQIFVVIVNILTGNFVDSVIKPNTPRGWKRYCAGWGQLICYPYTNYRAGVGVCGGRTHVEHIEMTGYSQGSALLHLLKQSKKPKIVIFTGIGIHGTYNEHGVWDHFLSPSVSYLKSNSGRNITLPRLVWMSPHAPGILKTPRVPGQSYASVVRYNAFINGKLRERAVPVMDTFNMTDGMMSFDGAHYGFGVNMLKSQIILNYISELQRNGLWK